MSYIQSANKVARDAIRRVERIVRARLAKKDNQKAHWNGYDATGNATVKQDGRIKKVSKLSNPGQPINTIMMLDSASAVVKQRKLPKAEEEIVIPGIFYSEHYFLISRNDGAAIILRIRKRDQKYNPRKASASGTVPLDPLYIADLVVLSYGCHTDIVEGESKFNDQSYSRYFAAELIRQYINNNEEVLALDPNGSGTIKKYISDPSSFPAVSQVVIPVGQPVSFIRPWDFSFTFGSGPLNGTDINRSCYKMYASLGLNGNHSNDYAANINKTSTIINPNIDDYMKFDSDVFQYGDANSGVTIKYNYTRSIAVTNSLYINKRQIKTTDLGTAEIRQYEVRCNDTMVAKWGEYSGPYLYYRDEGDPKLAWPYRIFSLQLPSAGPWMKKLNYDYVKYGLYQPLGQSLEWGQEEFRAYMGPRADDWTNDNNETIYMGFSPVFNVLAYFDEYEEKKPKGAGEFAADYTVANPVIFSPQATVRIGENPSTTVLPTYDKSRYPYETAGAVATAICGDRSYKQMANRPMLFGGYAKAFVTLLPDVKLTKYKHVDNKFYWPRRDASQPSDIRLDNFTLPRVELKPNQNEPENTTKVLTVKEDFTYEVEDIKRQTGYVSTHSASIETKEEPAISIHKYIINIMNKDGTITKLDGPGFDHNNFKKSWWPPAINGELYGETYWLPMPESAVFGNDQDNYNFQPPALYQGLEEPRVLVYAPSKDWKILGFEEMSAYQVDKPFELVYWITTLSKSDGSTLIQHRLGPLSTFETDPFFGLENVQVPQTIVGSPVNSGIAIASYTVRPPDPEQGLQEYKGFTGYYMTGKCELPFSNEKQYVKSADQTYGEVVIEMKKTGSMSVNIGIVGVSNENIDQGIYHIGKKDSMFDERISTTEIGSIAFDRSLGMLLSPYIDVPGMPARPLEWYIRPIPYSKSLKGAFTNARKTILGGVINIGLI